MISNERKIRVGTRYAVIKMQGCEVPGRPYAQAIQLPPRPCLHNTVSIRSSLCQPGQYAKWVLPLKEKPKSIFGDYHCSDDGPIISFEYFCAPDEPLAAKIVLGIPINLAIQFRIMFYWLREWVYRKPGFRQMSGKH